MEESLHHLVQGLAWPLLLLVIAGSLGLLGKGADWLVAEAVALSERWGVPKVVIGATVVSLGTTSPEAAVSVLAAIQGSPDLALGNAVGSILCDTGLILGLAAVIAPLRLDRRIVNRQGWIQLGAGVLLVLSCVAGAGLGEGAGGVRAVFAQGGRLPQALGFLFLVLLAAYLWMAVRWAREEGEPSLAEVERDVAAPTGRIAGKLALAVAVVVSSSWVLIPAVEEAAVRIHVPRSIIAATLVAFGTSLPELVTAVTAARRGHGELAIGNVMGADILNVFFVAGTSAAVTPAGLVAPAAFFRVYFPAMLFVLLVLRGGIVVSRDHFRRPFGFVLLGAYAIVTVWSYF